MEADVDVDVEADVDVDVEADVDLGVDVSVDVGVGVAGADVSADVGVDVEVNADVDVVGVDVDVEADVVGVGVGVVVVVSVWRPLVFNTALICLFQPDGASFNRAFLPHTQPKNVYGRVASRGPPGLKWTMYLMMVCCSTLDESVTDDVGGSIDRILGSCVQIERTRRDPDVIHTHTRKTCTRNAYS